MQQSRLSARIAPLFLSCPHWTAGLIIVGFGLLRLWIAASGQIDLAQDEAQYWDWSRRLQWSYYSKGPLIAWIIASGTSLFGDTELGVRIGAVLGNALVQGMLYFWLGSVLRRPRLALLCLAAANTMPLFIAGGVLMTTDNPLMVCWLAALIAASALVERPRRRWPHAVVFVAVASGVLAKYTMLLMLPLVLVYLVVVVKKRIVSGKRAQWFLGWALAGALAGSLPILLWNMQNDFVSFRHVATLAAGGSNSGGSWLRLDRLASYGGAQLGLLLPWWLALMLWQGWGMLRRSMVFVRDMRPLPRMLLHCREEIVQGGVRDTSGQEARPWQDHFVFLLCLGFWPIWLGFLIWSLHAKVYPNWSAVSYVSGLVFVGMAVERIFWNEWGAAPGAPVAYPKLRKLLPWCAGLSLAVCVLVHGQKIVTSAVDLPPAFNPTLRLKGWSDLGERVGEIIRNLPDSGRVFVFSNAYDVTAAMAFYVPGRPITYCVDFGRRMSQYDLWPAPDGSTVFDAVRTTDGQLPPDSGEAPDFPAPAKQIEEKFLGADAVFVTRKPMREIPAELYSMFTHVGDPERYVSLHEGRPGREFGILVLHGFTGKWPRETTGKY